MNESHDIRLKRLRMRSMRRGIKEMDIILSHYAGARLDDLGPDALDLYEDLLEENDQDLYQWITGQTSAPARLAVLVEDIARQVERRK